MDLFFSVGYATKIFLWAAMITYHIIAKAIYTFFLSRYVLKCSMKAMQSHWLHRGICSNEIDFSSGMWTLRGPHGPLGFLCWISLWSGPNHCVWGANYAEPANPLKVQLSEERAELSSFIYYGYSLTGNQFLLQFLSHRDRAKWVKGLEILSRTILVSAIPKIRKTLLYTVPLHFLSPSVVEIYMANIANIEIGSV